MTTTTDVQDVLVIGGGAAGLSAAVALGRSRRRVTVVDAGGPRNAPAAGVHGLLTRDGMAPADLVATGRAEAARYGAQFVEGRAVSARRVRDGFEVDVDGHVEGAGALRARRLVVATGLVDDLPPIPGLAERWGRDVVHCPYCHGYEVRDTRIVVIGGPNGVHQAGLFRQLSADVTLVGQDAPLPAGDAAADLAARGVDVVDDAVAEVLVERDAIVGVRLRGGTTLPADTVVVGAPVRARSDLLTGLGARVERTVLGEVVASVPREPVVPGVWVAGNVGDMAATVVVAAAQGLMAGALANADLVAEDTARARAARDGVSG